MPESLSSHAAKNTEMHSAPDAPLPKDLEALGAFLASHRIIEGAEQGQDPF
jgi:hypothetical protein